MNISLDPHQIKPKRGQDLSCRVWRFKLLALACHCLMFKHKDDLGTSMTCVSKLPSSSEGGRGGQPDLLERYMEAHRPQTSCQGINILGTLPARFKHTHGSSKDFARSRQVILQVQFQRINAFSRIASSTKIMLPARQKILHSFQNC